MVKVRYLKVAFLILVCTVFFGCAPSFRSAKIDTNTGKFDSNTQVEPKCIKTYNLLPNIKNVKYAYLKATYSYDDEMFYNFIKNGLYSIGIEDVKNEQEISDFVLSNDLSNHVTSISDPISLHKLAEVTGPFLFIEAKLEMVHDCTFRFDLKVTYPATNTTVMDVSRVRLVWWDLDKEVNLPMLNLVKKWYDESAQLEPSSKDLKASSEKAGI